MVNQAIYLFGTYILMSGSITDTSKMNKTRWFNRYRLLSQFQQIANYGRSMFCQCTLSTKSHFNLYQSDNTMTLVQSGQTIRRSDFFCNDFSMIEKTTGKLVEYTIQTTKYCPKHPSSITSCIQTSRLADSS